ncbi:L,D-transpeptidase [Aggregatilinea lenta]|uniref:L,D-transpeptidase n=1 Tax=Aggregatilinea lenta TaxID=913108 RepID=UPI000E5A54B7|nr:L,D-transpeptidase [Aggregatilinea lenta]
MYHARLILAFLLLAGALVPIHAATEAAPSLRNACQGFTADAFASPDCDAEMAADPQPPVAAIAIDHGTVAGYTFMRVIAAHPVQVLSAPGGGRVLHTIDAGFNFITPRSVREGWVEINPGEYVAEEHLAYVQPSLFTGMFIQAEPPRPFGWILKHGYASDRPGGAPVQTPEMKVTRYTLTYVYSTVNVDGLDWYLVGPGKWVEQRSMGLIKRVARPEGVGTRWVAVDLYEQVLVAYEGDAMVFATLVSSGLPNWSTREGVFEVWTQQINAAMSGAEGLPDYYRLENVPYALYFDGNISLHGTYWHDGFGYRHSHGCVNMTITDAHWLYDWLGVGGSVYVYYSRAY